MFAFLDSTGDAKLKMYIKIHDNKPVNNSLWPLSPTPFSLAMRFACRNGCRPGFRQFLGSEEYLV